MSVAIVAANLIAVTMVCVFGMSENERHLRIAGMFCAIPVVTTIVAVVYGVIRSVVAL